MDTKRLIGEVAARHGVRLGEDDPALMLVTLTELMLSESRAEFVAAARKATLDLVKAAEQVQEQAGSMLAWHVRAVSLELRREVDKERIQPPMKGKQVVLTADEPSAVTAAYGHVAVAVFLAIMVFVCGVLIGRNLAGE